MGSKDKDADGDPRNDDQPEKDKEKLDREVYIPFLQRLVATLSKDNSEKTAERIIRLEGIVKVLSGVHIGGNLLTARSYAKNIYAAYHVKKTESTGGAPANASTKDGVSASGCSGAQPSAPKDCSDAPDRPAISVDEQRAGTPAADSASAQVNYVSSTSAYTGTSESATRNLPPDQPHETGKEDSDQPGPDVATVEPSTKDAETEESVVHVTKHLSNVTVAAENVPVACVAQESHSPSKDLDGCKDATDGCAVQESHGPSKDLDECKDAAEASGDQDECSRRAAANTDAELPRVRDSVSDCISPDTRDCSNSPKDLADETSTKPRKRNRSAALPPVELMPWKLLPFDGEIPKRFYPAEMSDEARSLDPRCSGTLQASYETPAAITDCPEMSAPPAVLPPASFDISTLASLADWLKDKNERGEQLRIPLPVSTPAACGNVESEESMEPNGPKQTEEPKEGSSSEKPQRRDSSKSNEQSDDDCVITGYFRDSRPFHLTHMDTEPALPPEFMPRIMKTEVDEEAAAKAGCDEDRKKAEPRIARRKIHERYEEYVDDWNRRNERGRADEVEARRKRREKEDEERRERIKEREREREKRRDQERRELARKHQAEVTAASMNLGYVNPLPQQVGLVPQQGGLIPQQSGLMPQSYNAGPMQPMPYLYPYQNPQAPYMPQPLMGMQPHFIQGTVMTPQGPVMMPMMYPSPNPAMMNNQAFILPNQQQGPLFSQQTMINNQAPIIPNHTPSLPQPGPSHSHAANIPNKHIPSLSQAALDLPTQSLPPDAAQLSGPSATNFSKCKHCDYVGNGFELVSHSLHLHPSEQPPVRLTIKELRDAQKKLDSSPAVPARQPTGIACLDDLGWIPSGSIFPEEQKCQLCPFRSKIRATFIHHVQRHREDKLAEAGPPAAPLAAFNCQFCERTFTEINVFYNHVTGHTGEYEFKCTRCKFRARTKAEVQVHVSQEHPHKVAKCVPTDHRRVLEGTTLGGYGCSLCGFVQLAKKGLDAHVAKRHLKGSAKVMKINMSRSSPRPAPTEQKAKPPQEPRTAADATKAVAIPRRAPPVKVKGDPRNTTERATNKDLATAPNALPKRATRSASLSESPRKLAPKPNSSMGDKDATADKLRSFSIPKKTTPPKNGAAPSPDKMPSKQPPGLKTPEEAVVVQDTSQFASNIIIKSEGQPVGLLTMEVEIGEVTNPEAADDGLETESGLGALAKLEDDDMDICSDGSDDTVEMNFEAPTLMPPSGGTAAPAVLAPASTSNQSGLTISTSNQNTTSASSPSPNAAMPLQSQSTLVAVPSENTATNTSASSPSPDVAASAANPDTVAASQNLTLPSQSTVTPSQIQDAVTPPQTPNVSVPSQSQNSIVPLTSQCTVVTSRIQNTVTPSQGQNTVIPSQIQNAVTTLQGQNTVMQTLDQNTVIYNAVMLLHGQNTVTPSQGQHTVVPPRSQSTVVPGPSQNVTIKSERVSGEDAGPVPSIADTISKLRGQLQQEHPEGAAQPEPPAEAPPAGGEAIHVSSRRLKDWSERRKVLICGCLFAARSTEAFTRHREHWHKGEKRAACPECGTKLDSAADFAQHLWGTCPRARLRSYACSVEPLCRFTTSWQQHFVTHVGEEHAGIQWLPCYWCGKQYTTADSLAGHLSQCATRAPMLRLLQSGAAGPAGEERAEAGSPDEPAAPHLQVVYRCYVIGCQHESLEREVLIDHVQVDHPERKEHGCYHCEDRFASIYAMVLHMEEKHRERDSAAADRAPSPVAGTSREGAETSQTVSVSRAAQPVPAPVAIATTYQWCYSKKLTVPEMTKLLSLSYEVISSARLNPAQLATNLANWLEIFGPYKGRTTLATKRCVDPLVFARQAKSAAAMDAVLGDCEKLSHLYKCAGKECTYTTGVEDEYRKHLQKGMCRSGDSIACLYCGDQRKTVGGAVSHVSQRHLLCVNQCPHCIYRTKNKGYLMFHIAGVHPREEEEIAGKDCKQVKMMICPGPANLVLEDELPDLFSLSPPIPCAVEGCAFITMDPLALVTHHRGSHGDQPAVSCFHCMESMSPSEIETHLQIHQVFKVQCRYCSFGTSVAEEIIRHLCNIHPNRTGRVVLRECTQIAAPLPLPPPPPPPPQGPVRIKEEPVDSDEHENLTTSSSAAAEELATPTTCATPSTSAMPSTSQSVSVAATAIPSTSSVTTDSAPSAVPAEPNLHACGYQPCRFSAGRLQQLGEHLAECCRRYPAELLYCRQCYSTFREPASFLEHLRSHLAKVFVCGLCGHKADLPHFMKTHVQEAHGLAFEDTRSRLRLPEADGASEAAEYIYEPVVPRLVIRQDPTGGPGLTSELASAARAGLPESLEVDDVDGIPTQSIFTRAVKCRRCSYSSKVRQNLIRHVEQCKKERSAAANRNGEAGIAAASANASDAASSAGTANPSLRIWHPRQAPGYVKASERYRCCIGDCTLLEANSADYEDHIQSAHEDAVQLPCPHCAEAFDDIADFHLHMRLHGPDLFRCGYCTYHHYMRNLVSGHCLDQHPGVPAQVRVLRQEHEIDVPENSLVSNWRRSREEAAAAAAASSDEEPRQVVFTCSTCNKFSTASESAMRVHIIAEMQLETFSCSLCSHTCDSSAGMQQHFGAAHPRTMHDFSVSLDPKHEGVISRLVRSETQVVRSSPARTVVYLCPACAFSHPARDFAKDHILGHLQKQNNKCAHCGALFARVQHLRRHHGTHHADAPFVYNKEKDVLSEAFVEWVLKLLEDEAYGDAKIKRPINLTCNKNGCLMQFDDLKRFKEHFKKHVRRGPAAASDQPPQQGTSADLELVEEELEGSPEPDAPVDYELHCPFCSFRHLVKANVRRHILRHYDFKFFACAHCAQEGLEHKDVVRHSRAQHPSRPVSVIEKPRPPRLELRQVGNVRKLVVVDSLAGAEKPAATTQGRFHCGECEFATSEMWYARYHCQNLHPKASILKIWNQGASRTSADGSGPSRECGMCHERLAGPQAYLDHVAEKHGSARMAKRKANNNSNQKVTAKKPRPSGAPTDVVAQRCRTCRKLFREAAELRTHARVFHPDQPAAGEDVLRSEMFRCPRCSFASAFFAEAKDHMRREHGRPFRCGLCAKLMWSHDAVVRHSRFMHRKEQAMVERNPAHKEEWLKLLRLLKRSGRRRKPTAAESDGEVTVVEIEDDDEVATATTTTTTAASPEPLSVSVGDAAAPTTLEEEADPGTPDDTDDEPQEAPPTPENSNAQPQAAPMSPENSDAQPQEVADSPESPASSIAEVVRAPTPAKVPARAVAKKSTTAAPQAVVRKRKRRAWEKPVVVGHRKRINLEECYPEGFSFYGFRPEATDFSKLSIFTNFRGLRNAKMSGEHLREVFNLFPVVVVEPLRRDEA